MNPFRALHDAGVPLAFGSDTPVTPLDPWGGVRAAVRHRTPGSGLPLAVAYAAATVGGWRAAGMDGAGELRVGQPATFAVWTGAATVAEAVEQTPSCVRTVVRGRTVFAADPPG